MTDFIITEDIILETLLSEAEEKVRRFIKKGKDIEEATDMVSSDMDLTKNEKYKLQDRLKNKSNLTNSDELKITPKLESLFFESADELNQATGIMMYKGIPWSEKGQDNGRHFIQFENADNLAKAHEALKRKWSFVENKDRKVAVVEFDNLQEYHKVLEFMNRQGMLLEYGGEHPLDDDFFIESAKNEPKNNLGRKKKKMVDEDLAINSIPKSFIAKRKDITENVNPTMDPSKRMVKVRKKWN